MVDVNITTSHFEGKYLTEPTIYDLLVNFYLIVV